MNRLLILTFILFSFKNYFACINEYRTLLSGKTIKKNVTRESIEFMHDEIDTLQLQNKAELLLSTYLRTDSISYYSDYGAALIYLGKYKKAKQVYIEIENLSPNLYTTASNLGTLYELIGLPDSALYWIKKSVAINPDSHNESEWIHIKILEFKLLENQDYSSSILGLDFGNELLPSNPNKYDLEKLYYHLRHQLFERTRFVKPQNTIVGNIYFDLGNVAAQTEDIETSLRKYELATKYDFKSELMNQRIQKFKALVLSKENNRSIKDFLKNYFPILFWSGLIIGGIVLIFTIRIIRNRK